MCVTCGCDFMRFYSEEWVNKFKTHLCDKLDIINSKLKTRELDFAIAIGEIKSLAGELKKRQLKRDVFRTINEESIEPIIITLTRLIRLYN